MKTPALALLVAAGLLAIAALADESASKPAETTTAGKSKAEVLVEASRAAKAKKNRKSSTKVITNSDVKKSKGKIVETKLPPLAVEPEPTAGMVEIHEATKKASVEERARIEAAAARVADFEEEVAAIEQQYYEESDLDRRDREIVARFNDAKRRLDDARRQLAAYLAAAKQADPE